MTIAKFTVLLQDQDLSWCDILFGVVIYWYYSSVLSGPPFKIYSRPILISESKFTVTKRIGYSIFGKSIEFRVVNEGVSVSKVVLSFVARELSSSDNC